MNVLCLLYVLPAVALAHAWGKCVAKAKPGTFAHTLSTVMYVASIAWAALMAFMSLIGGYFIFATVSAAIVWTMAFAVLTVASLYYAGEMDKVNEKVTEGYTAVIGMAKGGLTAIKSLFKKDKATAVVPPDKAPQHAPGTPAPGVA
jgi:hypothetical protein